MTDDADDDGATPAAAADGSAGATADSEMAETDDLETLREEVEAKYDFEDFGPADMAEMSADEWEAAFDPETWTTGEALLDRVEADLKQRIANRDVFARLERLDDRIIAYADNGYATVYGDGTVEGRGTVLRDVKPTVALCSMDSYDVPDDPPEELLPEPTEVPEGSGELGNRVLQAIAAAQVLAGVVLLGAGLGVGLRVIAPAGGSLRDINIWVMLGAGVAFVGVGLFLFTVVANARLSDKFRAEEYRNRLEAVDFDPAELPEDVTEELPPELLARERDERTEEG